MLFDIVKRTRHATEWLHSPALFPIPFPCREEQPSTLVEFGAGDGSPVISTLLKAPFTGTIHAFELNPRAAQVAHSRAQQFSLGDKYKVHNGCFFKGQKTVGAECLIANPPYLPAPGKM